jgi:hypothetical protein
MHVRVSAIGDLGVPASEQFTYGFTLVSFGSQSTLFDRWDTAPNTEWQLIANAVQAFHAHTGVLINPSAVLKKVKLALIGENTAKPHHGAYLKPPKEFAYSQAGGGGVSAAILPQSSLVVTLGTGGLGKVKGRFYVPMPSYGPVHSDGFRLPVLQADAVAVEARNMLNTIRGVDLGGVSNDLKPAIISGPTDKSPTRGFFTEVAFVRVGRVIDTMRSRRRNLLESYGTPLYVSG